MGRRRGGSGKSEDGGRRVSGTLDAQLAGVGLRAVAVPADGNCLFRSVADQIGGGGGRKGHAELRARCVAHMHDYPSDFAPFVEDDGPLEAHLTRMARDGEWGGHLELQALSVILARSVAVHQLGQPVWLISNVEALKPAKVLHLAYRDGEHYDSVRVANDHDLEAPAMPVPLEAIGIPSFAPSDALAVAHAVGCTLDAAEDALRRCLDIDGAINFLFEGVGDKEVVGQGVAQDAPAVELQVHRPASPMGVKERISARREARRRLKLERDVARAKSCAKVTGRVMLEGAPTNPQMGTLRI